MSFETDDDKWKWGGIIGGVGLATIVTGVMVGCFCRNCLRTMTSRRATQRAMKVLYDNRAKQTVLCVEDEEHMTAQKPSAPPYDGSVSNV